MRRLILPFGVCDVGVVDESGLCNSLFRAWFCTYLPAANSFFCLSASLFLTFLLSSFNACFADRHADKSRNRVIYSLCSCCVPTEVTCESTHRMSKQKMHALQLIATTHPAWFEMQCLLQMARTVQYPHRSSRGQFFLLPW